MNWNNLFRNILEAFAAKFPLPDTEELSREWLVKLGQTFDYHCGSVGRWGSKRYAPGYPLTKDGLTCENTNGLFTWDVVFSAGSPDAALNLNPETINTQGQSFVYGGAVDWITGIPTPTPVPIPTPTPTPVPIPDLKEVYDLCVEIKGILNKHFR